MIKLIYRDEERGLDITHTLPSDETWGEVLEHTKHFLLACGYIFDPASEITLSEPESESDAFVREVADGQISSLEEALEVAKATVAELRDQVACLQNELEVTQTYAEGLRHESSKGKLRWEDRYEWSD
jgi:uncharacterized small protein (DUF1192 family)